MSLFDNLMVRFRRITSPPGAPAAGAVPLDEEAARYAEISHLFPALDAIESECREIDADAIRVEARTAAVQRAARLAAEADRGAAAQVERLRADAAAWMPSAVGRALERVRASGTASLR